MGKTSEASSDWRGENFSSLLQIGPIPVDDSNGKEIVTKLTTPLKTEKTFYTDSNGRDFLKRASQSAHHITLEVQIVWVELYLQERLIYSFFGITLVNLGRVV